MNNVMADQRGRGGARRPRGFGPRGQRGAPRGRGGDRGARGHHDHQHPRGAPRGRGGPDRAQAVPEPEVREPVLHYVRYSDNVKNYALGLPAHPEERVEGYRKKGYRVMTYAGCPPHPVSAGMRRLATATALGRLHALGVRTVFSVFGSTRDVAIAENLNNNVDPTQQLRLFVVGSAVVTQDMVRRNLRFEMPDRLVDIGVLLVDVYQWPIEGGDFKPVDLAYLASYGPVAWVGHQFIGAAGTIEGEGAWIRDLDGKILSRPDAETICYPVHSDANWLTSDGKHLGVAWTACDVVSSFRVVMAAEAEVYAPERQAGAESHSWLSIPLPALATWQSLMAFEYAPRIVQRHWVLLFGGTVGLVDLRVAEKLADWVAFKSTTVHSLRQLDERVRNSIYSQSDNKLLKECFPRQFALLVTNTSFYVFTNNMDRSSARLRALNLAFGPSMSARNHELNAIGKESRDDLEEREWEQQLWKWVAYPIMIGACVASTYFAGPTLARLVWEKVKRTIVVNLPLDAVGASPLNPDEKPCPVGVGRALKALNNMPPPDKLPPVNWKFDLADPMWWLSVVYAPVAEEYVKHLPYVGKFIALLMGTYEAYRATTYGMGRFIYLKQVGLHLLLAWLPMPAAILLHALHNYFAQVMIRWGADIVKSIPATTSWALVSAVLVFMGLWALWRRRRPNVPKPTRWKDYRAAHFDTIWSDRPVTDSPNVGVEDMAPSIMEGKNVVLKETVPNCPVVPQADASEIRLINGPVVVSEEADDTPATKRMVYYMRPVNSPGYSPAPSEALVARLITTRLMKEFPTTERSTRDAWANCLLRYVSVHVTEARGAQGDYVLEYLMSENMPGGSLPFTAPRLVPDSLATRAHCTPEESFENFKAHYEGDRHRLGRIVAAYESNKQTPPDIESSCYRNIEIMLKSDELLFQREDTDEGTKANLKSRPIAFVSPLVQADIGPDINDAFMLFKVVFHPCSEKPLDMGFPDNTGFAYRARLSYGGAATDFELGTWMHICVQSEPGYFHVLVSGDDVCVVIHHKDGYFMAMEFDMSHFDASQARPALRFQAAVMRSLGTSTGTLRKLDRLHRANYVVALKSQRVILKRGRPSRDTGGPDTSFGNSINVGFPTLDAIADGLMHGFSAEQLGTFFLRYGFKAKARLFIDDEERFGCRNVCLELVSFLKGKWWRTTAYDLAWAPLPSRVLKMGKSFADPCVTLGTSNPVAASERFLAVQAACYESFLRVPILGEMCDACGPTLPLVDYLNAWALVDPDWRFKVHGQRGRTWEELRSRLEVDPYHRAEVGLEAIAHYFQVTGSRGMWKPKIDYPRAVDMLAQHYDCDRDLIVSMMEICGQKPALAFLEHPGFEMMARRDYG